MTTAPDPAKCDEARGRACICRTCASGWRPPGKQLKENKT